MEDTYGPRMESLDRQQQIRMEVEEDKWSSGIQGHQQNQRLPWEQHIPSSLRCLDGSCTRRALQDWAVLDFFPQFGQSGRSVVLLFLPGRFAWLVYGASPFNRDGNTVSQPWASCPPGHGIRWLPIIASNPRCGRLFRTVSSPDRCPRPGTRLRTGPHSNRPSLPRRSQTPAA